MKARWLLLGALTLVAGCGMLPFLGSKSSSNHTETVQKSTSESVKVNGQEVEPEEGAPKARKVAHAGLDRGATCHKNDECASGSCFVGYGNLGYCTHICDSDMDCEDFWECKHVGNAPQRICMQQKS